MLLSSAAAAQGRPQPKQDDSDAVQQQIEQGAQMLGSWDNQYQVIEQATDNFFQQQGWSSEPDAYARQVMRDVGRISPFKPHERQKAFLDSMQVRYGLTQDQRTLLDREAHREFTQLGMRHFKEILPVALEVLKTRADGKPFTAEQVQRWSRTVRPIMDESLGVVQSVTAQLEKTMTEEQRAKLQVDMKALLKRHDDVRKLVDKWTTGSWTPTDWGLQNDPIHAGAIAAAAGGPPSAPGQRQMADEGKIATDESEWDRYVRWFCDHYQCTDAQRTQAESILRSVKKEATDYRQARRDAISQAEHLSKTAEDPKKREFHQAELRRLLAPIAVQFERLKKRLDSEIPTTDQRRKFAPQTTSKPSR